MRAGAAPNAKIDQVCNLAACGWQLNGTLSCCESVAANSIGAKRLEVQLGQDSWKSGELFPRRFRQQERHHVEPGRDWAGDCPLGGLSPLCVSVSWAKGLSRDAPDQNGNSVHSSSCVGVTLQKVGTSNLDTMRTLRVRLSLRALLSMPPSRSSGGLSFPPENIGRGLAGASAKLGRSNGFVKTCGHGNASRSFEFRSTKHRVQRHGVPLSLRTLRLRLEFPSRKHQCSEALLGRSEASEHTKGEGQSALPLWYARQDSWEPGELNVSIEFLGVCTRTPQTRQVLSDGQKRKSRTKPVLLFLYARQDSNL